VAHVVAPALPFCWWVAVIVDQVSRVLPFGNRIDPEMLEGCGPAASLCARVGGVNLHANVAVPARDRWRLERLCRYVARPPVAGGRLVHLADGRPSMRC